MKRLRDMNNKELEKANRITLIIVLICEIGVMIKNIVWYDDYSLAMIIVASFVIAGCIYVLIDQLKRYKRINKRKDDSDNKKGE